MEVKTPNIEQVLKTMEDNLGEEPRPMVLMSKVAPELVFRHAQDRKFVLDLPNIPVKYKQLIMVAVAAAASSHSCATTYIKMAKRSGISKEEIAEAIITARFTLGSTVVSTATEGLEHLLQDD